MAKTFLNLIGKHYLRSSKLHKIFNKNTVKVSYTQSCTQIMSQVTKGHKKRLFRNKHKRLSSVNVELRKIVPSMVIAERKVWYTNVQQQPVIRKKYILDWLKESSKRRGMMTMSNLLKTNLMPTVLPSEVMYGKWKKKKMWHQLLHRRSYELREHIPI